MARGAMTMTQPDAAARNKLRPVHGDHADALIALSQVAAMCCAPAAAANGYGEEAQ